MRTLLLLIALFVGSVAAGSIAKAEESHGRGQLARGHHDREERRYDEARHHEEAKHHERKLKGTETSIRVPELDPASFGAAAILLLGGAAIVAGRRLRQAI